MKGFTLIELMIVVAIVAILAAVALPSYNNSIDKSRRADAQSALLGFSQAMEQFFTANSTYVGAGAATATTYTLQAQPIGAMAGDGNLQISNTGARAWDRNNALGFEAGEDCWSETC